MNKTFTNTAVAILFSLGLTACSVNSGNGDLGTPITSSTTTTTDSSSSSSSSTSSTTTDGSNTNGSSTSGTTTDNTNTNGSSTSGTTTDNSNTNNSTTTPTEAEVKAAHVSKYTNTYFATKTDSYAYKRISDESEYAKLVAEAKAAPTLTGSCANNASSGCRGEGTGAAEAGKVMKSYQQSYSGYAVLRETYASTNADNGIPNNAFFYYVDTPTTDKSKVGATYTGQVSYSKGNSPAITGSTAGGLSSLIMNVADDKVSGKVTKTYGTGGTPTTIDVITFKEGAISVASDGSVGFSGTTEFNGHKQAFNTTDNANFTGTYKGQFAGANAEEMVGTFESDSTAKDVSVQGAFSATKNQ